MGFNYREPNHDIYTEMNLVHERLKAKYNKNKNKSDENRAKIMESYLRYFKKISRQNLSEGIVGQMENQALEDLTNQVGKLMGVGYSSSKGALFGLKHFWYKDTKSRWGADDVFEAELKNLLIAAFRTAIPDATIDPDVKLVGSILGNVSKSFLNNLSSSGQSIINQEYTNSSLIKKPEFKPTKIDIESFSGKYLVNAEIKPEWQEFIDTFKGAKFTVKNYSSTSSYEIIHLGQTVLEKSVGATLDSLYARTNQAVHIYFHAINHAKEKNDEVASHILHLRFAYELTGEGLYDQAGNKLSAADFFIYNDPHTENIWVRSTKSMIYEAIETKEKRNQSYKSNIIILKNNFT